MTSRTDVLELPGHATADRAVLDVERAVLSAILLLAHENPPRAIPIELQEQLRPNMFVAERHQLLFGAMLSLERRGILMDPVTLQAELALTGTLDQVGGMEYIAALIDVAPTAAHLEAHAALLREQAQRREVVALGRWIATAGEDAGATIVPQAIERLVRLHEANSGAHGVHVYSLAEILANPDALEMPKEIVPRLAHRGVVGLFAAREKSGKSTLLAAAAAAATRGGLLFGERCQLARVLLVSADLEHASLIASRAMRFGADPERLHVVYPRNGYADVIAAADRLRPDWIQIDTLSNYAPHIENPHSAAEWPAVLMPLVRLSRDRQLAITAAHHATKGEDGGYRDSTQIGASVDMIYEMHGVADSAARRRIVVKGRWPMRDFVLELAGDEYTIVTSGQLSVDAQVLAYITQHPGCSKNTLRSSLGVGRVPVDEAVEQLLRRRAIENRGSGQAHQYHPLEANRVREPGEDVDAPPF